MELIPIFMRNFVLLAFYIESFCLTVANKIHFFPVVQSNFLLLLVFLIKTSAKVKQKLFPRKQGY